MTKRKSTSYVCTLDVNSATDMQALDIIRKTVKLTNNHSLNKKRVVLRGRKPVEKKTVFLRWQGRTGSRSYDWAGNIVGGIKNATKLDVYIYDLRG